MSESGWGTGLQNPVFGLRVRNRCLDMGDEGGAEHLLAGPERLQGDVAAVENGNRRAARQAVGGAVDVQGAGGSRDAAVLEQDAVLLDPLDVPEAHDVPDAAELFEFGPGHGGAAVHGGPDAVVQPQQLPGRIQELEEAVDVRGLGDDAELLLENAQGAALAGA